MSSKVPYIRNYPKDFQNETVGQIVKLVCGGKNAQVIGVRGSGKSFLIEFLATNGELKDVYKIVKVDFNLLPQMSVNGILELISSELGSESKNNPTKVIGDFIDKQGKILFLIDSIYNVESHLEEVQRVIKAISDRYRGYVAFVFFTSRPILISPLWGTPVYIAPLKRDDFEWAYKGLGGEEKHIGKIYEATGGCIGLTKRLVEIASSGGNLNDAIENPRAHLHLNYQLELIREDLRGGKSYFDIPIYNTFLEGAKFDPELTKLESKALNLFLENKNKVVEREVLIEAIWGKNALKISDHALDQLMHRLKNKISGKFNIETVKGRGQKLTI